MGVGLVSLTRTKIITISGYVILYNIGKPHHSQVPRFDWPQPTRENPLNMVGCAPVRGIDW